jgi:phage terminase large subunit
LQAGNPTSHSGMLYAAATQLRDKWFIIRITGDPDDPRRSKRIDITWAGEQIRLWGRDNPWVMSFILGLFPPGGINSLLGPEDVEAAMRRHLKEEQYAFSQRRLGVDVARYGDDRTVIFPRQGLAAFRPIIMRGASTDQIAARVMMAKNTWDADMELVDGSGGWGAGVVDSMRLARATPIEVMFSGKAIDPRFHNKRAEMYFEMADWVKRGGALPNLPELVKELTQQTYTIKNGKFLMEEKEQIKQRLGFSPDLGDGLALTFGMPDQPRHKRLPGGYVLGVEPARQQDYNQYDSQRLKNR